MTRVLLTAIAATLLIVAVMAQTGSNTASGGRTNFWTMRFGEQDDLKYESTVDLHNPKTVTLCGDGQGSIFLSVDGRHWHAFGLSNECSQVPPVRFVKLMKSPNMIDADREHSSSLEVYATY